MVEMTFKIIMVEMTFKIIMVEMTFKIIMVEMTFKIQQQVEQMGHNQVVKSDILYSVSFITY
jgi:hypothetical protein